MSSHLVSTWCISLVKQRKYYIPKEFIWMITCICPVSFVLNIMVNNICYSSGSRILGVPRMYQHHSRHWGCTVIVPNVYSATFKRTNEEISCSAFRSKTIYIFYWPNAFCTVLDIIIKHRARLSFVWLKSSVNFPHNNLAFQNLTQHKIDKWLRRNKKLFMGIYKTLLFFFSNLDARSKNKMRK